MTYSEVRILVVPLDYGASLRFWTDGVGLDVQETFGDGAGVLLTLGAGVLLELLATRDGGPGPEHLCLSVRVADAVAAHRRLVAAGLGPTDPVERP